jgi:hypothetical protein
MQNENELPKDLSTAHDVIVMQSAFLKEQASRIDRLERDLAEAHAAFKKLLAGNRSEKYINPGQQLLENKRCRRSPTPAAYARKRRSDALTNSRQTCDVKR